MHDELGYNFILRLVMGQIQVKNVLLAFLPHLQKLVKFTSHPFFINWTKLTQDPSLFVQINNHFIIKMYFKQIGIFWIHICYEICMIWILWISTIFYKTKTNKNMTWNWKRICYWVWHFINNTVIVSIVLCKSVLDDNLLLLIFVMYFIAYVLDKENVKANIAENY